ncbi:UTP--glucose-1-phosphate uridylyltransferase, partial [Aliarcobacter butzleri]
LTEIRSVMTKCTCSYTRQREMKGLGHGIQCDETVIGDQPFAVLLADDLSAAPRNGDLSQMVELYRKNHCSIVAIEEGPKEET